MIAHHLDMAGLGLKKVSGSLPGGKYRPFAPCLVPASFGSSGRRDGEALSSGSRRCQWVWVVLWVSAIVVGMSEGWRLISCVLHRNAQLGLPPGAV